jgi:hypothetical protein
MATNDIIARLRVVGQAAFQGAMDSAAKSTGHLGTEATHADAATQKLGRGMGKQVSPLRKAAVGMAKVAGGAAAIYAAKRGLMSSLHATEDLAKGTLRLQRTTGMDAQQASAWTEITKVRGVQAASFQRGLVALSKQMVSATSGAKPAVKMFGDLGVSMDAIKAGDTQSVMLQMADGFSKMQNPALKAAYAQKLMARQGQELLPLFNQGSAAIQKQLQTAAAYGATLGTGGVEHTKAFMVQQRNLQMAMDGLKVSMGTALMPVILSLATLFAHLASTLQPFLRNATAVKLAVALITTSFIAYRAAVVASTIASLGMIAVWAAIPIAILAIGAALVYAYKKVAWFRNAVNAVGEWIKGHWKAIIFSLLLPLPALVIAVSKHFGQIKTLARKLPGALLAVGKAMVRALVSGIKAAPGAVIDAVKSLLPGGKVGRALSKVLGGVTAQFATGGIMPGRGVALVGERGPELLQLPGGARVTPLPSPALSTPTPGWRSDQPHHRALLPGPPPDRHGRGHRHRRPAGATLMASRKGLAHGYVRLICDDPHADVRCLMGADPPKITGGIGGWEIVARPRQVSMTTWAGVEPFGVDLALMLDGHAARRSVEEQLAQLIAVGRGDGESEPGLLRVQGIALPADRWVIDGMDFGDTLLSSHTGERVRQALTLNLREYVPPAYLQLRRSATLGSKGKTKTITTRKGDTPAKVAARVRCSYRDLRELNLTSGLCAKANQTLKVGTKLRVPVAKSKQRKPATRRHTSSH